MNLAPYRKAIVAVGAAVAEIVRVTGDGNLTTSEAIGVVIVLLGAFGVYQVANAPK
jgi:spore coat polysaccharide biosynthesis protein SpsF (cytidylyltransferase family)